MYKLGKVVLGALLLSAITWAVYSILDWVSVEPPYRPETLLNGIAAVAYQLTIWFLYRYYAGAERKLDARISQILKSEDHERLGEHGRLLGEVRRLTTVGEMLSYVFLAVFMLSLATSVCEYFFRVEVSPMIGTGLIVVVMVMSLVLYIPLLVRVREKYRLFLTAERRSRA